MPRRGGGSNVLVGRLARGSIAAFVTYGVGAGLTYGSQLVVARLVGPDSYGMYAYVLAWMTMLAYFSALGFDVSLLRLVPAYRTQEAWGLLRGVVQYAQRRAAAVGLAIVATGSCVVTIGGGKLSAEFSHTFLIGFVLVPVWALLWLRSSVVRAWGGVVSALAPDRLVRDGMLLAILGIASLSRRWNIDAPFAMAATLASSAIGLGLVSLAMRRWRPRMIGGISPEYDARIWRRAALPLVMIAVAETFMNRTGVVLLGWMGHTKEAGIYALAFNVTSVIVLPRIAVNTLLAPMVSELFVRNDRAALQDVVTRSASWTLLGAASIALPLSFLADPLLGWFGHGFGGAVPTMRVLLVGQVVAAAAGSQLFLMTMTGNERGAAVLLVGSAVGNAALAFLLIGLVGPIGAAIASTTTLVAWNAAMGIFISRNLQLAPGVLGIVRWHHARTLRRMLVGPRI